MAYGDLNTLAQIAPTLAGSFAGANQAQDEQTNNLKQKELADLIMQRQQEAAQKAQMNPLLLQHQDLTNQGLQAGLPGIVADASLKGTNASKAAGTLDSDVAAGNTANRTKMYTEVGTHLGSIAGAITDNPGVSPHLVLMQQLQGLGLPQDMVEGFAKRYAGVAPSDLVGKLKADSDRILRETPAYAQATDVETQQGANRLAVAQQQGANLKGVEQMRIDAGKYDKKGTALDVNQALLKYGHSAAATAEIYDRAAQVADSAGDSPEAQRYTTLAQQARQRAAEDARNRGVAQPRVDVGTVGSVPMVAPPAANAPVGIPGAPPPAAPGAAHPQSLNDLSKLYPGVPPDQLRAAYKRKFGVDLK